MEEMKTLHLKQELIDKIIHVAYGDASIFDKIAVYWNVLRNDAAKNLLAEYKRTATSIHTISREEIPDYIIESARGLTKTTNNSENLLSKFYFTFYSKPVLSASIITIIILGVVSILLLKQPQRSHQYSNTEIELAQKQLGESLAIVNKVFQNTEKTLDAEVISKHVSKPLSKGLIYLNDYLIGG